MEESMTATDPKSTPAEQIKIQNPHVGHRARMRARFRASGLDGFASHEVLEFLLYHTHSRCDTNEIAHNLIEAFGSLPGVLEASYEELKKVDKIGDVSATFIPFLLALFRRYSREKEESRDTFDTISRLNSYCRSLFVGSTVEQVYMLLFDNSMHILDCTLLAHGTVNSVSVMTRRIAEKALEKHASFVVITHNHPDGLPLPSAEDIHMTNVIEDALSLFQIPLLEHILVANTECVPLIRKHRGLKPEKSSDSGFLRTFYELDFE